MQTLRFGVVPGWRPRYWWMLALLACCRPEESDFRTREKTAYAVTDSMGAAPSFHTVIPIRTRRELVENSGAAMSREQPGVLFTINDSGNEPVLFALDTTGVDRGAWRVANATNRDWEAISTGPCIGMPASAESTPTTQCVYVGDVGDNDAVHDMVFIYQVREPVGRSASFTGSVVARKLAFRYEDGAHDVEAMFMAPDSALYFVTKRALKNASGKLRPALVFRLPASAWQDSTPAVAPLVDSLPVIPGSALQRTITDAALSPNGRWLAVRTYRQLYILAVDSSTHRIAQHVSGTCNIFDLNELQGEGMTWLSNDRLILTSEGHDEPLHILECAHR